MKKLIINLYYFAVTIVFVIRNPYKINPLSNFVDFFYAKNKGTL
jgi:hypothetical protein